MDKRHIKKLRQHIEEEKNRLEKLDISSEVINEKKTLICIMEDFFEIYDEHEIDPDSVDKIIAAFETFDNLTHIQEKKFLHKLLNKSVIKTESKEKLAKKMAAFNETISMYEQIIHSAPELEEDHERCKIKKKHLTDHLLTKLEDGLTVYEISKSMLALGRDIGLARLLPLSIFLL